MFERGHIVRVKPEFWQVTSAEVPLMTIERVNTGTELFQGAKVCICFCVWFDQHGWCYRRAAFRSNTLERAEVFTWMGQEVITSWGRV